MLNFTPFVRAARSCTRPMPAVAAALPVTRSGLSGLVLTGVCFFVLISSAAASTRSTEIAELTAQWDVVAMECEEPIYPASVTSNDRVIQIKAERAAYKACLAKEIKKLKQRTSAKRMTDPALWRKLKPRERTALESRLKKANTHVVRGIEYDFQRHSARADVIIRDYYDQGYPSMSVKDKAMRDARKKAEAARAAQARQSKIQSGDTAPAARE
jgi:hypothetical protein